MSTFMERFMEAGGLMATAEVASREAAKLDKEIKQRIVTNTAKAAAYSKLLSASLKSNVEVDPLADPELEQMQNRATALWERARHARMRLEELETDQAQQAEIRVISTNAKGAQIAIHYFREDGKKVSFTRHVHHSGLNWVGLSTLSTQKVTYRQPGTALVEAA